MFNSHKPVKNKEVPVPCEKDIEKLKGQCDNLTTRVLETVKELMSEIDKKKKRDSKNHQSEQ